MQTLNFSQEGFEKVKKELEKKREERKTAVVELSKAREMGDLRENGYYKAARMKVNDIDRRIRELSHLIKNARIYRKTTASVVNLGATVTLHSNQGEVRYAIVGAYEANPSAGNISDVSPLGRMLLGKKVGDIVKLTVPIGEISYTITQIV